VQGQLTETNELANQLEEMGVVLSYVIVTRLESVQKRCKTLQTHATTDCCSCNRQSLTSVPTLRACSLVTLQCYSARVGMVRVLSFKLGVIIMCRANPDDKYRSTLIMLLTIVHANHKLSNFVFLKLSILSNIRTKSRHNTLCTSL
jgi:uracil phosphoribosyltransferase